MQNLDSLSLKFFYEENADFLNEGVIQKIQMPSRQEIIFSIRNNGLNRKLYININPKYPHIYFFNDKSGITIPKSPPMFCMQLRKYLEGAKIVYSSIVSYERILEFHFSISDELGIEHSSVLAVELMGKHSNVILYSLKDGLIIGCAHNISADKSSVREIYGGIKYIYPPKQNKFDILRVSFAAFCRMFPVDFFYFTKSFADFLISRSSSSEKLFRLMQSAVVNPALIKEFWKKDEPMNDILYEYYSKIVLDDLISNKKNKLLKNINVRLKKLEAVIKEEVNEEKFKRYKKFGDLIFQYIYLISPGHDKIILEGFEIPLNSALSPAQNAKKYYKLYTKLKSAKNIAQKRKVAAILEKEHLEGVLFSVQNVNLPRELDEIEEEISIMTEKNGSPSNKEFKKPVIEPVLYEGFEILLGKNNKQNDFLIRKLSAPEDLWLHAQGAVSSHIIIKTQNGKKEIPNKVLLYAAKLVKENSPFKNSGKAPVIYTRRKFLKRPPDTPLGYVTYREEKEIIV